MNVQRFFAFVLLISLALASGPGTAHTNAAPPSVTARAEATGSWRSSGPYGGHADALALSPNFPNDGLALAGGWRIGYAAFKSGQGLLRSDDGGQTWSRVPQGIPDDHDIVSVAFSPAFGQDRTAFAGTWQGLFRSRDGGASWQKLAGGLPTHGFGEITTLALSPAFADDGVILAGSRSYPKMWRSTDGGDTWAGVLSTGIAAIALSPNFPTDGLAFAGGGDLYRSTDGGLTWTSTNFISGVGINSLAVSPNLSNDATLFAGTSSQGVLRSTDYGDTWTPINTGLGNLGVNALALSPAYPGDPTLFAGTSEGLYRSTDGGQSWATYNEGIEGLNVSKVVLSPDWVHDRTLFAIGQGPTHRSTDGGASWQPLSSHLPPLYDLALSPNYAQDRTLFACYREIEPFAIWPESGVVRSTDGGETWELASMGLPGTYDPWARSIALSPNFVTDRTLYVAYQGSGHQGPDRIFRSTDAGDTWIPLPPIPGEPRIRALTATGPNAIHVATANGVWHYSEEALLDIVVNGGFEEGFYLLKGQSLANGWAAYTLWGQPTFAGERFTVHSGRWAHKISGYAPFAAALAQTVSVQPGVTCRVTAYYHLYPPGDGQALLGVQDGTSATQWVGGSQTGVWQPLSQEITVTSGRLTITLQGRNGPVPNANVYFDDVTVAAVGSP